MSLFQKRISKQMVYLLGTVLTTGVLAYGASAIASSKPMIIDAKIEKFSGTGFRITVIDKNSSGAMNVATDDCKVSFLTEPQSFWPMEELKSQSSKIKGMNVDLMPKDKGIQVQHDCKIDLSVKKQKDKITVTGVFQESNEKTPAKPTLSSTKKTEKPVLVKPRPRPEQVYEVQVNEIIPSVRPRPRPESLITTKATDRSTETENASIENVKDLSSALTVEEKPNEPSEAESTVSNNEAVPAIEETTTPEDTDMPVETSNGNTVPDDVVELIPPEAEEIQYIPLPTLYLEQFEDSDFSKTKAQLVKRYSDAYGSGADGNREALDLAQFYVSQMFLHEARSMLDSLNVAALSEDEKIEADALSDVISILFMQPLGDKNKVVGNDLYAEWSDWSLWTCVEHSLSKEWANIPACLSKAADTLREYPYIFQKVLYPVLLEGAIESETWSVAREMAIAFEEIAKAEDQSALSYLLGKAAEKNNLLTEAFDSYTEASKGDDHWAQKSRLSIVDIGLATETMPLTDAATFLEDNRYNWRGDDLELEALKRLAVVRQGLGERDKAVMVIADIIRRFPKDSETEKMRELVESLMDGIYEDAISKKTLNASDFTKIHNNFNLAFGLDTSFAKRHIQFADYLSDLNLTSAAVAEYKKALTLLDAEETSEKADQNTVLLKMGINLYNGGLYEDSVQTLLSISGDLSPELIKEKNSYLALAQYQASKIKESLVTAQKNESDLKSLTVLADASWIEQDWTESKNTLLKIKEKFPESFTKKEAVQLVLSAHRSGDPETVTMILKEFPEVMEDPAWLEIAEGLVKNPESLSPLNEFSTDSRIERSNNIENTIQGIVNQ